MSKQDSKSGINFDGLTVLLYLALVAIGLFNIFAAVYKPEVHQNIFSFSLESTKQLTFFGLAVVLIVIIMVVDMRVYEAFAYPIYVLMISALVLVLLVGSTINGSKSWFMVGGIGLQPAEFAKFATALALAKFLQAPRSQNLGFFGRITWFFSEQIFGLSRIGLGIPRKVLEKLDTYIIAGIIIAMPALLIIIQGDTGSAMVFGAFAFVLYREKIIPHWMLLGGFSIAILFFLTLILGVRDLMIGILSLTAVGLLVFRVLRSRVIILISTALIAGYIFSINYIVYDVLKNYQRERIMLLVKPIKDKKGQAWNLVQSKIAIGSGGFAGKGYLQGTQTKLGYVPEQSTDFIFCTIGEEHGWIGSFVIISLYLILLARIIIIAERQKDTFVRVYGYSVASIIFFHFAVNIGMTIGLFPVVGIPLPLVSKGGSSLWSFSILLFILLKLDAHRKQVLARQ
ncbi:MAG TPA: rod shape-determining protein RodA [Microscillaceae bacterium]|nr:rod shape-determining protein RodA [Microscillaceae bacterium]